MSVATHVMDLNSFAQPSDKRRKLEVTELEKFAAGAIIKVRVKNFMTYVTTEFNLSPYLNMIIGPNGTGKSTFVSAVCLGLGGTPTLLGRQKVVGEFIKNGEESAVVEITLKNKDGLPNLVVQREMYKNNDKSDWTIDGKPASERKVRAQLAGLSVQLDNLCQFLPQEKVADFAKLTPEKLLVETQRAIDTSSLEKHEKLIELDSDKIKLTSALADQERLLAKLESKREEHEENAKKYQQYEEKKADLETHEKLLPWAHLSDYKSRVDSLKQEKDKIQRRLNDLNNSPLEIDSTIQRLQSELDGLLNTHRDMKAENKANMKSVEVSKETLRKLKDQKIKLEASMKGFASGRREMEASLNKLLTAKEDIENTLQSLPEYDEAAAKELEKIIDDLYYQKGVVSSKIKEKQSSLGQFDFNIKRLESELESLKKELRNEDRISVLDGPRNNNPNRNYNNPNNNNFNDNRAFVRNNARSCVMELRTNLKEFKGRIFEPPVMTVTTTEEVYARYLDKIVDSMTQLSMTAIDRKSHAEFTKIVVDEKRFNAPFRYLSGKKLKGAFSREELNRFGFECYLEDVLRGPEPVIQMLREQNYIFDIPISKKPLTSQQIDRLINPPNGRVPFKKFFSGDELITITTSRYGSRQNIIRSETVSNRNIMFSTGGLSNERKAEISARMKEIERSKAERVEGKAAVIEAVDKLKHEYSQIDTEFNRKSREKKDLLKIRKDRSSVETRLETTKKAIKNVETQLAKDNTAEILKCQLKLKRVAEQSAAAVVAVAETMAKYNSDAKEISLLGVKNFVIKQKIAAFNHLNQGVQQQRLQLEEQILDIKRRIKEMRVESGVAEWQKQIKSYTDDEKEILIDIVTSYTNEGKMTLIDIETIISSLRAELGFFSNSSKSSIKDLKELKDKIDGLQEEIPIQQQKLKELKHEMKTIQEAWEPRLQDIIDQISSKFQEIFPTVGSAGEVQLVRSEKFEDWRLEILVAFREESELKALDSHTQSGGERAVSTVYFMISLQNLTNSPFRVVDEINQGMDARNERIVHENMVKVACQENTSQYFLITPKLLTDLYYHPRMRIHCILAGPWIPNPSSNANYLSLGTTSTYV